MDLSTLDAIWKVVLVFGLIVFVHELGHFSLAKLVGVGVERFSLGFGPKLVGRTVGETEYLISAVRLCQDDWRRNGGRSRRGRYPAFFSPPIADESLPDCRRRAVREYYDRLSPVWPGFCQLWHSRRG